MIPQKDIDGKYKLTGREYTALLRLFAAQTALMEVEEVLKDRLKTFPNGWRDFRMLSTRMATELDGLLDTVPIKKLIAIQRELKSVKIKLQIGPDAAGSDDQVIYVNEEAFLKLLDQIVAMNCMLCDKKGKDVKRCPWLQLIEDCLPYSPDPSMDPEDGSCQIAGRTTILEDDAE